MAQRKVNSWLDTILSDDGNQPHLTPPASSPSGPSRKRRRLEPLTPETPAAEPVENEGLADVNETSEDPNAEDPDSPAHSHASQQSDDASSRSGSTCIDSDAWFEMDHRMYGVIDRGLTGLGSELGPLSPSLKTFLKQVQRFSEGKGVLPSSSRRGFKKLADRWEDMEWAEDKQYYSKSRNALGHTPPAAELRKVVYKAQLYDLGQPFLLDGITSRVLDLALEPADGVPSFVNCCCISDASYLSEYTKTHDEPISNFCMFLDLYFPSKLSETIDIIESGAPSFSINHAHGLPRNRPLAASINTSGEVTNLGIWESARWACLRDLLKKCKQVPEDQDGQPKTFSLPEYLPGILVDRHEWYLVITTHHRHKTTIWNKILIGSTSSIDGIYQVIACLQLVQQWAVDVFWPWMKEIIHSLE